MPQLYTKKHYSGKRLCLALRRATFLPPASWRVSSGVFYELFSLAGYLPIEQPKTADQEKHKLLAELDILTNRVIADTNRIKSIIRQFHSKP